MAKTKPLDFDAAVSRGKREINEDIASGTVPATVRTFGELHNHVDANGYGGAFEHPIPDDGTDAHEKFYDFWNRVHDRLHRWLQQGRPEEGEQQSFEDAIDANPLESTTHAAYADWLDEHGKHDDAQFRRAMADWVGRGEFVTDRFKPPSDEPKAFQIYANAPSGHTHSVYRSHLPDWASGIEHVGESREGVTQADPAVAYHPNIYWYHWRGYRNMEAGLRRAFVPDATKYARDYDAARRRRSD